MATGEHKKLAAFIKQTHNNLRQESRLYGPSEAWQRHLARTDVLQNYATTMQELATAHWNEQTLESDSSIHCRNKWINLRCYEYFFNGGYDKFDRKENDIRDKMMNSLDHVDSEEQIVLKSSSCCEKTSDDNEKIKLLDVGSCYNPLAADEVFDVTAIDLSPYSDNVLQCDFLHVPLGIQEIYSRDGRAIEQLQEASFNVVVFSLLLEYFPCPEQRFLCCQKAYKLLKTGGILIVITPDSNHVGANAKIMKSWRFVLSRLGFMRIVYEKLRHLHCLAFRKCADKTVAVRWSNMQLVSNNILFRSENKIYIPQDFQTVNASVKSCEKVVYDAREVASAFEELPCLNNIFE